MPVVNAAEQKEVLVIYSTRRDAQIVAVGERELPRILEKELGRVDYYSEYIDEARFPDASYRAAFQRFLRLKYDRVQFDAVVTVQDPAFELVRGIRGELFAGVPIVSFTTGPVTGHVDNATGLVSRLDFSGTLDLIAALQPETRNVYIVTGAAPSDKEYERLAREQFARFTTRFTLTYLNGLPTRELMSTVGGLPANSAIYYLLVNRDGAGENVHPLEYLDRLTAAASAPVYCWVDSAMDRGIVGGSLKDQDVQLEALGRLAVRVISGEAADSIPVSSPDLNLKEVDWRQLRRWGISESRGPAGPPGRVKDPAVWDRYRVPILSAAAVFVAQSLLIAGLLVQRQRRRVAEGQAHASREALRNSNERVHDLGSRLLTAQDTERARIARDLHDDVSQQIALLAIDIELLSHSVTPGSEALAIEALTRTQDLASTVHELSHQLHPARLRLIGLVSALQALERELSRSDQVVAFTHADVPLELPFDLRLALFRIAQEVLHNAANHSRARVVRVHLQGGSDGLVLSVVDDGVGFDVAEAWGKGLGLISIGERIDAMGGTLDLRTSPGAGTSITIRVPLTGEPPAQFGVAAVAG